MSKILGTLIMSALFLSTATPIASVQDTTQNNDNTNIKQITEKSNTDDKILDGFLKIQKELAKNY